MVGRIFAAITILLHLAGAFNTCYPLIEKGFITAAVIFALIYFFSGVSSVGLCMIIGAGFEESVTHGLLCMFAPFYFIYYGAKRCQEGLSIWGFAFVFMIGTIVGGLMILSHKGAANETNNSTVKDRGNGDRMGQQLVEEKKRDFQSRLQNEPETPQPQAVPWTPPPSVAAPVIPQEPENEFAPPQSRQFASRAAPQFPNPFEASTSLQSRVHPMDAADAIQRATMPQSFRECVAKDYFSWIAGDKNLLVKEMRWIPIAKRPARAVRWGLGVFVPGTTQRQQFRQPMELTALTGPIGLQLVNLLGQRLVDKRDGKWSENRNPLIPRVPSFSAESEESLMTEAESQNLDGMVMVFISSEKSTRARTSRIAMVVRLVDVPAHKATWSSQPLNNQRIEYTKGTAKDASVQLVQTVSAKLDEQFGLAEMPELSQTVVERRAERLAADASKPEAVLRALVELRYFEAKKLLGTTKARSCYESLLGAKTTESVIGGSAEESARALDAWFNNRAGI